MRAGRGLAVTLTCTAGMAVAQDVSFDTSPVIECLHQGAQHSCLGAGLDTCARQNGASTVVIEACLKAEFGYWQGLADRAYSRLEARGRSIDADTQFDEPLPPRRVDALERSQAAWLDYRAAHCAYQMARWHGGSGAGGAYYRCMMELTGTYALQLQPDIWRN